MFLKSAKQSGQSFCSPSLSAHSTEINISDAPVLTQIFMFLEMVLVRYICKQY